MRAEFPAKYSGRCAAGDAIQVGDLVCYTSDDEVVHAECRDRPPVDELTTEGKEVCQTCFATKPCFCD